MTVTDLARADLDPTTAFSLLSADRRRAVAAAVDEANEPVSTSELAAMLAAREERVTPEQVHPRTHQSVRQDLEEIHLPRLDTYDVIERHGGDRYGADRNLDGLLAAADAASRHLGSTLVIG
jgi:hypothetical protein